MESDEIDALELKEKTEEIHELKEEQHRDRRLNMKVALTIALLATFMGICKVKKESIVLIMQQTQAEKLDDWNYYQARHIREDIAHSSAVQMQLNAATNPSMKKEYQVQVDAFNKVALEQQTKMKELQQKAEEAEKKYETLYERNDQFDLAEAGMTIAIAILAITTLMQFEWLYWLSLIPTAFGVVMGLAGLLNWNIHPQWLIKLLGS